MTSEKSLASARSKAKKMGLSRCERTIMLCADHDEAGCASAKQMTASWKFLKRRLKELGLSKPGRIQRLRIGCCGVCKAGPIVAVMPDQIWYGRCNARVLERIIQEHLVNGRVVREFVIAEPGDHVRSGATAE